MKRIREWEVLDTRDGKTSSYIVAVVRKKDGPALCKFSGARVTTYYGLPGASMDKVCGMAKTFIKHLESRGCVVMPVKKTRRKV